MSGVAAHGRGTTRGYACYSDQKYLPTLVPRHEAQLEQVPGSSITYRIDIGPQQGRKAFTLQTLPAQGNREERSSRVAKACGGAVRVTASIKEPVIIETILAHVRKTQPQSVVSLRPQPQAPPAWRD